jgi:hypothetical protein
MLREEKMINVRKLVGRFLSWGCEEGGVEGRTLALDKYDFIKVRKGREF